jgi:phosphoribosyl-ATP pyrophosphohydrolase/phosphoribosyl-AMP cyclohydrolase
LLRAGQGNDERKGRKGAQRAQRKDAMDAMGMQVTIDFGKDGGLVAGIVQDAASGEVLMLGFLNEESYRKTVETGFVTFWSRTRQKLWMKGETSGNRLRVVSAATDCDNDALLFRVHVEGDGLVCHEGTVSCFTKPILGDTRGEIRETK